MRAPILTLLCLSASVLGLACNGKKVVLDPVRLGMTDTIAPFISDGEISYYQVATQVLLPIRQPTGEENAELAEELAPYPREPFYQEDDTRIVVRFSVTNLDDVPRTVVVLVDPWNEFVRYVPGTSVVREDELLPNLSGIERTVQLEPKQRITGVITPDDFLELARDLGTAMSLRRQPPSADGEFGGAVLYNRAMNRQNREAENDPLLKNYLPDTIAGVLGFELGLRTTAPANLAIEAIVDVDDQNRKSAPDLVFDPRDPPDDITPYERPGPSLSPP